MSAIRSMKKIVLTVAVAAAGLAGATAISPGAAHASDAGRTVRISPLSNPFLFLDVQGGSTASTARIIQWSLSGDNQVWTIRSVTDSLDLLVNKNSGKCMESDGIAGDQVFQAPCDTNVAFQLWDIEQDPVNPAARFIVNSYNYLYLEVYGGSSSQGAKIDTWPFDGYTTRGDFISASPNQEFYLDNA